MVIRPLADGSFPRDSRPPEPMARHTEISSPKSPLIQRVRQAGTGERVGEMLVDGARLVGEAMASPHEILVAVLSERFAASDAGRELSAALETRAREIVLATDAAFQRVSSLTTPQGVLAVIRRPQWDDASLCGADASGALVVAAAGVRDPGNLGAMLRATEAAGGTGFLTSAGSADPYREKAVRGSAGSVLRLPTRHGLDDEALLAFARARRLQVVVAAGDGEIDYLDADLRGPTLFVLGSEGGGVPEGLRSAADVRVRIPIRATVESLNVAVATGVLLFEVRRQRR